MEKSHDDSVAWSRESYLKDPKESHAQNHASYMKDLEKSCADSAARSPESYKKDLENVTEMKLAWLYPTKVRNSCSLIGLASDKT